MTDERFHQNWHQVRVFTKNFVPGRYADLLGRIVVPLVAAKPNASLFLSYYFCPLNGALADNGDTNIAALPPDFLSPHPQYGPCHCSVRIRFRETRGIRKTLKQLLQAEPDFWFSHILSCALEAVLDPLRFSTQQENVPKLRRIRRVVELLHANSIAILDTIANQGGLWIFEQNNHGLNQRIGTVGQSILHMVVNPWSRNDSDPLPVFWGIGNHQFVPLALE